ncbi:hypothetical protein QTG54_001503 [Skeletonema marinoi]|uniref:Very-long-chain (3R)-3-hydroxyacyl-CoA dehydratase n=1 Tax=Skeletonema marinoi TaxID=267567 RepID=A0AAD9DJ29_9STRA|nr:hypothetical protein QTG54_001503 [Skeletonema marinoi]
MSADRIACGVNFTVRYEVMISTLVLYSWALTEVGRYPMYLFPSSAMARYVRLVLPIVTFLWEHLQRLLGVLAFETVVAIGLLVMVVGINSLLGPTMAYPALLKKGLPVLLGKKDKSKSTRKKKD